MTGCTSTPVDYEHYLVNSSASTCPRCETLDERVQYGPNIYCLIVTE